MMLFCHGGLRPVDSIWKRALQARGPSTPLRYAQGDTWRRVPLNSGAQRTVSSYGRSLLPQTEKAIKNDKKMEKGALPLTF
jgi:hypothetical protein